MSDEPSTPRFGYNWTFLLFVIGLLAVLVIAAWLIIRANDVRSRDLSVSSNLRQIVQGAEDYFREHPGISSAEFSMLVGTNPSQYVRSITARSGESYSATILRSRAVTASGISGARTITYAP